MPTPKRHLFGRCLEPVETLPERSSGRHGPIEPPQAPKEPLYRRPASRGTALVDFDIDFDIDFIMLLLSSR
jgi:hypothetical protein